MKVGIVQNRIIYGGRLAVIVGIIEVLNQRDIVPDLITFQTEISPDGVCRQYGKQINFKIRRNSLFGMQNRPGLIDRMRPQLTRSKSLAANAEPTSTSRGVRKV